MTSLATKRRMKFRTLRIINIKNEQNNNIINNMLKIRTLLLWVLLELN